MKKNYSELFTLKKGECLQKGYEILRITEENKERYRVIRNGMELKAGVSSKLLFAAGENQTLPSVGDWVAVTLNDDNESAVIHEVLPRKTLLERKSAGKKIEGQIIAANIDFVFIVTALDADFSLNRIERYLVISNRSGATPILLLSKSDLIESSDLEQAILEIKEITDCKVIPYSAVSGEGIADIKDLLGNEITFCLVGSSGVGKSTLVNKLAEEELMATSEISESSLMGRHTTTRRQMLFLKNGSILIDTPGMWEVGLWSGVEDLNETFDDIYQEAQLCKFNDCTHTHEPGCAVIEAVERGEIDERRYCNYLNLREECESIELKTDPVSKIGKKQKDKKSAKAIKNYNKTRKNR